MMEERPRTRRLLLRVAVAFAALITALAIAACGGDDDDGDGGTGGGEQEARKLGLLMDVPRNDRSFGTATFLGAQRAAKEFNLELSVVDELAAKGQEAQTALENFARESDYVINGASPTYGNLPRVAEQFPDTEFRVYAVPVEGPGNLAYAYQDWYPLGYLAGIVAAMSTESGTVGFVGGGEIPPTLAGRDGYKDGVEAIEPQVRVLDTITGSFTDPVKGKSATAAQIASQADVVYSFLDAAHEGAVQAAKPEGIQLMSVILPKCDFSEGLEIGDTLASQDQLVFNLVKQMVDGKAENVVYGLQDPDVASFQFCPGKEDPQIEAEIRKATAAFNSGELKSPDPNASAE
jgi:basic membrane protein A and related proteins